MPVRNRTLEKCPADREETDGKQTQRGNKSLKRHIPGRREDGETDYCEYQPGKKQILTGIAIGLALSAFVAFLFYRSAWAMALAVFFVPFCLRRRKNSYIRKRKERLMQQFKSGMQMVAGTLAAGASMENAWRSAQAEVGRLYGTEAEFYLELRRMNQKVYMNEPLDQVFLDFARRSGSEDICNFAEIVHYARKSGGNLTEIIRSTVTRMQEKSDILEEIENAVTAKRSEQKMMNLMVPGILLFVTVSSPEYVSALYGSALGILVMSVCLAGYLGACLWSEKLVDIQI